MLKHTDKELRKIAKDMNDGKIFTHNDPQVIQMTFMVLMFMEKEQMPDDVGMIYEYFSEAGPRSINGYPIFFSAKFLTVEETENVINYYHEIKDLLKEFEGDE